MYYINTYFDTQTCAKCVITIHTKMYITVWISLNIRIEKYKTANISLSHNRFIHATNNDYFKIMKARHP
jgi:hypothetical protein